MVGITGPASAHQTRLLGHKSHMVAIAYAPWLGMRQDGLLDRWRLLLSFPAGPLCAAGGLCIAFRRRPCFRLVDGKAQQLGPKRLLNVLGVCFLVFVLLRQPPVGPFGRLILAAGLISCP